MLDEESYAEACRHYKDKKYKPPEQQRYHALILVMKGYGYRETREILLMDEETASRWIEQYWSGGLDGLKNHPQWGGEHSLTEAVKRQLVPSISPSTVGRFLKAGRAQTTRP